MNKDTDIKKIMGKSIQKLRKSKGLTQEQFSEMVGLSKNYISDIECGKSCVKIDKLIRIINGLQCTADDIFMDVAVAFGAPDTRPKIEKKKKEEEELKRKQAEAASAAEAAAAAEAEAKAKAEAEARAKAEEEERERLYGYDKSIIEHLPTDEEMEQIAKLDKNERYYHRTDEQLVQFANWKPEFEK